MKFLKDHPCEVQIIRYGDALAAMISRSTALASATLVAKAVRLRVGLPSLNSDLQTRRPGDDSLNLFRADNG
jgi:hypothetical protein